MHRSGSGSGDMVFTMEENHGTEEGGHEEEEQYGGERCLAKKPRIKDEEEELLTILKRFRANWAWLMPPDVPLDATTEGFRPMYYTESGPPRSGGIPYDAMEIFSLEVAQTEGGLEWPLHVYGLVAVRDSMDSKRNILFHRSKNNCQVLAPEDHFLELTGPSRAIALIDNPEFEVELYVTGRRPSEEKVLSALHFEYNNFCNRRLAGQIQTLRESCEKRSTIELKFAHMRIPLEAPLKCIIVEGQEISMGVFLLIWTTWILDSKESKVAILSDGRILLSRRVVLVDEDDKLRLHVRAWQSGDDGNGVGGIAEFPAKIFGKSNGEFNVSFCKMSISVAWSVLV